MTSSLNDIEKKYSILLNDHQQYKTATEHTLFVLKNQLNASEEIVKQLFPGNIYLFLFIFVKNLKFEL